MSVKINSLQLENVKRIKAVKLEPTENGLTLIGGKNNQGKTSVLDSIAYALGGADFKPSNTRREGSMVDPYLRVTLSNGIIAERKGKSSILKVTDPSGNKAGQALLDSFVSTFALDLPKFMNSTDKEKAKVLLQIIGVGDKLAEYDLEEDRLANERLAVGRIKKEKEGHAEQMVQWDGVPAEPISASDLIRQQQEILARNGENQRKRDMAKQIQIEYNRQFGEVKALEGKLADAKAKLNKLTEDLTAANKSAADLHDESTEALQRNLEEIESINAKVRDNLEKAKAQMEAEEYVKKYAELNDQIERVRNSRMSLLDDVKMPLDGLSVDHGTLIFNGQPWDNMSGSDQLKVATAIVRKLKPECGFVLMDKLEQMDLDTLKDFGAWLEAEGLQAIATRVSTGDECTVYIEDGYSVDHDGNKTAGDDVKPAEMMKPAEVSAKWEAGKF